MTTAEINTELSEQELVERWRADALERAGYSREDAVELASRTDIDLHGAVKLLENGCPLDTALAILR
jgi:hypothetical protein